ncbi:MAG: hypothetical protein AAGG11_21630 [Pseudomonadota bacterium]
MVASLMRSGTHLLIDSLLNNCRGLRRSPLYIDLDQLLSQSSPEEALALMKRSGTYVVKTHFPQLGHDDPARERVMTALCEMGTTITVTRERSAVERSFAIFSDRDTAIDLSEDYQRFAEFWSARATASISFEELTGNWADTMAGVWRATGLTPDPGPRPPLSRAHRYRVYLNKLLTRLVGRRAPMINTTIGFALKR